MDATLERASRSLRAEGESRRLLVARSDRIHASGRGVLWVDVAYAHLSHRFVRASCAASAARQVVLAGANCAFSCLVMGRARCTLRTLVAPKLGSVGTASVGGAAPPAVASGCVVRVAA